MTKKAKIFMTIATFFGSGLSPKAPGTCGSLAALPFGALLLWLGGSSLLLLGAVVVFFLGWLVSDSIAKEKQISDPQFIVIDEVAGQFIALCAAGLNLIDFGLAFFFFRLFDITKPFPASFADRKIAGGLGIMLDDVFAGIYAFMALYVIKTVL
ncbi:MAG: phosphatidylglycerophosphatase A [Alphaproteobacteria bacterium]|nr:phosphatidylglycerophosphatase A [Alphaproteobacteria bacterium]